jgi:pyrroloquinoline quinone biosynthesis protein E
MQILWVLPDYFEDFPKPCMGGWGRQAIVVTPNGEALPCHGATSLPDVAFDNVRERHLHEIWFESEAFNLFRGTTWMSEPCRTCPLGRQEIDFGGCRCQAFALTGRAQAADPVCHLSPDHALIAAARDARRAPSALVYRTARVLDRADER